jgi:hypothetical protein
MQDVNDPTDYLPTLIRGLSEAIDHGRSMAETDLALASAVEEATVTIIEAPHYALHQSAA